MFENPTCSKIRADQILSRDEFTLIKRSFLKIIFHKKNQIFTLRFENLQKNENDELLYEVLNIKSLKFSYFFIYLNFMNIKFNKITSIRKTKKFVFINKWKEKIRSIQNRFLVKVSEIGKLVL